MSDERGQTPLEASSSGTPDEPIGHTHVCDGCGQRFACACEPPGARTACFRCQANPDYYRLRQARREGLAYWLGGALLLVMRAGL